VLLCEGKRWERGVSSALRSKIEAILEQTVSIFAPGPKDEVIRQLVDGHFLTIVIPRFMPVPTRTPNVSIQLVPVRNWWSAIGGPQLVCPQLVPVHGFVHVPTRTPNVSMQLVPVHGFVTDELDDREAISWSWSDISCRTRDRASHLLRCGTLVVALLPLRLSRRASGRRGLRLRHEISDQDH